MQRKWIWKYSSETSSKKKRKKFFSEKLYFDSINTYFKTIQNHLDPFITIYQDEYFLILE